MSSIQSAFGSKISPIILVIIVLLAAVFFISALLHLLIRYLIKQRSANSHNYPQVSSSGAFQRQLQQLFHLHDSGLDQAYIDALPVFLYKDIMGSKEPFDCAVCLCEFSEQDRLRLLPSCSHAFHIDCIDTWLLSNSTCPLCRGVILSNGYSYENPFFYFEDSKESVEDGGGGGISGNLGDNSAVISEKRVFSVRLGKFKSCTNNNNNNNTINNNNNNNNNNGGGGNQESEVGESSNLDARRCFSMGSFQYVVDELDLQVALCPSGRERGRGGQNGNFVSDGINGGEADGKKINNRAKGESFSVSKIWLWSKKGKFPNLP